MLRWGILKWSLGQDKGDYSLRKEIKKIHVKRQSEHKSGNISEGGCETRKELDKTQRMLSCPKNV